MFRTGLILSLAVLMTACGGSNNAAPTVTAPPATTPGATAEAQLTATPVVLDATYARFARTVCSAFASGDSNTISNNLAHYQYNSGVRYGQLGDGEGQTGDPSILPSWLGAKRVRCKFITPSLTGHGTVLANGWSQPGGWGLIELDVFDGHWRINDFTFGSGRALFKAMQVAGPVVRYRG